MSRPVLAGAALIAVAACNFQGSGVAPGDAGDDDVIDAPSEDAAVVIDARTIDGPVPVDAGHDAAIPDAEPPDAVPPDAEPECDFTSIDGDCVLASNLPGGFDYAACLSSTTAVSGANVSFGNAGGTPVLRCSSCGPGGLEAIPFNQPGTDVGLAVFCVASVDVPAGATWEVGLEGFPASTAIVIVSAGAVTIAGTIDVSGGRATMIAAGPGGPGGFAGGALAGGAGADSHPGEGQCGGGGGQRVGVVGGGGGGGGFGGRGGDGGAGRDQVEAPGGAGGDDTCDGDGELTPLLGGSGGGSGADGNCNPLAVCGYPGGGGGGAIQISSAAAITLTASGQIVAEGGNGFGFGDSDNEENGGAGGGGAGGAILLESPTISVAGSLVVDGGDGGVNGDGDPGGDGASGATIDGEPGPGVNAANTDGGAGGGGGGGRVRLNGGPGVMTGCNRASPGAACSAGAMRAQP